jgi:hypothetical protein
MDRMLPPAQTSVIPNTRKARVRNLLFCDRYFFPGKYFFSTDATTT